MNLSRALFLAAAFAAGSNAAYAADSQDHARVQQSIYDVVRGENSPVLQQGRSSVGLDAAPVRANDNVLAEEPFYFRKANERGSGN